MHAGQAHEHVVVEADASISHNCEKLAASSSVLRQAGIWEDARAGRWEFGEC